MGVWSKSRSLPGCPVVDRAALRGASRPAIPHATSQGFQALLVVDGQAPRWKDFGSARRRSTARTLTVSSVGDKGLTMQSAPPLPNALAMGWIRTSSSLADSSGAGSNACWLQREIRSVRTLEVVAVGNVCQAPATDDALRPVNDLADKHAIDAGSIGRLDVRLPDFRVPQAN